LPALAPWTPSGRSGSSSRVANDIRSKIVGLNAEVTLGNGSKAPLINSDNAATTPAFTPVLEEVNAQLEFYGSVGRGFGSNQKNLAFPVVIDPEAPPDPAAAPRPQLDHHGPSRAGCRDCKQTSEMPALCAPHSQQSEMEFYDSVVLRAMGGGMQQRSLRRGAVVQK
jgi:hypothetical protein